MTEGSDRGGLGETMETAEILGVEGWEKEKKLFLRESQIREAFIKNINK